MTTLFSMRPATGRISGTATNVFGQGGNFIPAKKDRKIITSLRGKATPGSTISIPTKKNGEQRRFVRFDVRPSTIDGNTRCELATGDLFPFGKLLEIDISFRIRRLNAVKQPFYLLQFWQPVISPIAGIRIDPAKRLIECVTRTAGSATDFQSTAYDWCNLRLLFRAGTGGMLKVTDLSTGVVLGTASGAVNGGSQAAQAERDAWRPKFGFYGNLDGRAVIDVRTFKLRLG